MIIREAVVEDALAIMSLHQRSVLGLCGDDYTREQLIGWVNRSSLEKYQDRLENHRSFVAEQDQKMIGYVRWYPKTRELCSIYVDPEYIRQGVASALMDVAIKDALKYRVDELWLDASLTAIPFYGSRGWIQGEISTNGHLECVRMTKLLPDQQTKKES